MSTELKPCNSDYLLHCPFCGDAADGPWATLIGPDHIVRVDRWRNAEADGGLRDFHFSCSGCGANGGATTSRAEAVAAWNRRAEGWRTGSPPGAGEYMIFSDGKRMMVSHYFRDGQWSHPLGTPTHWRPLPGPPEEDQ